MGRGEYLGLGEFKFRSLGVSSCHNALMSSAHRVSAAECFSSSLLGCGGGVCVRARATRAGGHELEV